ncbi:hypothetical protein TNCV_1503291 [Trichonephila clavipes]|uniref:Uncharacterized protein n=1 Tax=Trichonephila clavipes TaxID=2585209 RepID=A0A8X6RWK7_TRICX|nr:hypothetical protein TNCV_1503291 [Trichonephila clavipes]
MKSLRKSLENFRNEFGKRKHLKSSCLKRKLGEKRRQQEKKNTFGEEQDVPAKIETTRTIEEFASDKSRSKVIRGLGRLRTTAEEPRAQNRKYFSLKKIEKVMSLKHFQHMQLLPRPAYSSDMSPIEHVFDLVVRRLPRDLHPAASKDELLPLIQAI